MKHIANLLKILLLILFIFTACDKDENDDTENPVIIWQASNSAPQECDTLYRGASVHLEVKFMDNEQLSSYSVGMAPNFSNQSPTPCTPTPSGTTGTAFSLVQEWALNSVQEIEIQQDNMVVPETATTGGYLLEVTVYDMAGNSSSLKKHVKILEFAATR